jgi:hypothetical protein
MGAFGQVVQQYGLVIMQNYFREGYSTLALLIVTITLMSVLYDRATTPTCALSETPTLNIPQDWLVEPPKKEVRP